MWSLAVFNFIERPWVPFRVGRHSNSSGKYLHRSLEINRDSFSALRCCLWKCNSFFISLASAGLVEILVREKWTSLFSWDETGRVVVLGFARPQASHVLSGSSCALFWRRIALWSMAFKFVLATNSVRDLLVWFKFCFVQSIILD